MNRSSSYLTLAIAIIASRSLALSCLFAIFTVACVIFLTFSAYLAYASSLVAHSRMRIVCSNDMQSSASISVFEPFFLIRLGAMAAI